jgi:SOS-response transcriptional repressor LexA
VNETHRPTKKQRELLSFIDGFIKGNGYGPSYREVMRALEYKSVSTVAAHVDGLIARGYLRKKDNSARTLEVVMLRDMSGDDVHEQIAALFENKLRELRGDDSEISSHNQAVLQEAMVILALSQEDGTSK